MNRIESVWVVRDAGILDMINVHSMSCEPYRGGKR